jgi:hypothetical protein
MPDYTYRLSRIPEALTKDDIRRLFSTNVGEITALSLAPSISDNGGCQVATLTFRIEPTFDIPLSRQGGECVLSQLISEAAPCKDAIQEDQANIRIDNHFYGLTPLHSPNPEEIIVE